MTKYGQPLGMTQLLPETAREMAGRLGLPFRENLLRGKSPEAAEYQKRLGRAYFEQGLKAHGGDLRKGLMYYHGGPDQRLWGPKTRRYADSVISRMRGR